MNASSRLTVRQKLYAASSVLVLSMIVLATSVWVMLTSKAESLVAIEDNRVPQLTRIAAIELNVTRASLQLRHAILARSPEEQAVALADIAERKKVLETTLKAFGDSQSDTAGRQAFEPLPALMQKFWAIGGENLALIQRGQKEDAVAFLVDQTIPARNALLGPLGQEKERQTAALQHDVHAVLEEASFTRNLVAGIVLMVSVGVFLQAVWLVRVMGQLGSEPDQLRQAADAVAQGDLAAEIPVRPGDTSSVMAAMAVMRSQLANTVRVVRQNAESVATASTQIAQGNADLSQRTEQQASALQHTASSMEQLGTTVKQNSDSARQANEWAKGAAQVAERGGSMVVEVVDTMRGINESSRRIADIIGVIDGIAFQTNILALNAAVEAARAGEQGRGFAVVAGEVRSLAQRSAEAAKEIKTLIQASVQRVDHGTELVDRAGETMKEIVQSIQRVHDVVASITSASDEQSQGVQQVGQAVQEMDHATQQNAALVEQSAAAAESLKHQAQQLVKSVASFRLA